MNSPEEFLRTIETSGLLAPEQLERARAVAKTGIDAETLAARLVGHDWVTGWQMFQLLNGRTDFFVDAYRLLQVIHRGNGIIYKAAHPTLQTVALRVLSAHEAEPDEIRRLSRAQELAESLAHPHLVTIYEYGKVGNEHYLSMEFVAGRDLAKWIAEDSPLPVEWVCRLVQQVSEGLAHVDAQRKIHGNLRPDKILTTSVELEAPLHVKVLGAGLGPLSEVRDLTSVTPSEKLPRAKEYLAPELIMAPGEVDIRADIFSLGCILFHALTGEPPFTGQTSSEIIEERMRSDSPRATARRSDLPKKLDQILARMLCGNVQDRFQTPQEVIRALASISGDAGEGSDSVLTEEPEQVETPWGSSMYPEGSTIRPTDGIRSVRETTPIKPAGQQTSDQLGEDSSEYAPAASPSEDTVTDLDRAASTNDPTSALDEPINVLDSDFGIEPPSPQDAPKPSRSKHPTVPEPKPSQPRSPASNQQQPAAKSRPEAAPQKRPEPPAQKKPRSPEPPQPQTPPQPPAQPAAGPQKQAPPQQPKPSHKKTIAMPKSPGSAGKPLSPPPSKKGPEQPPQKQAPQPTPNAPARPAASGPSSPAKDHNQQAQPPRPAAAKGDQAKADEGENAPFSTLMQRLQRLQSSARDKAAEASSISKNQTPQPPIATQPAAAPPPAAPETPPPAEAAAESVPKDPEASLHVSLTPAGARQRKKKEEQPGTAPPPAAEPEPPRPTISKTAAQQPLFLIVQSNKLLGDEELAQAAAKFDETNDPAAVLDWLLKQNLLTKWQADRILNGETEGFYIGEYRLLGMVEKTSTGQLFEAEDPAGKPVLLKVLSLDYSPESDSLARLQRESRMGAVADHPHVAHVRETREFDGQFVVVMDGLTEARPFTQWINRDRQPPAAWVVECIRQAALGIDHLHQQKIVHRDVAPANLLIHFEGFEELPEVKVTGMSYSDSKIKELKGPTITRSEDLLGTVDYLAPEMAEGAEWADHRSDIYSLGCVLFHVITGNTPFDGASPIERLDARKHQEPPRLHWVRGDLPTELDLIVARALARDPEDRYQSAAELAKELEPHSLKAVIERQRMEEGYFDKEPSAEALQILDRLGESNLLDEDQFREAQIQARQEESETALVQYLTDRAFLTPWQVEEMMGGRIDFHCGPYQLLEILDNQGAGVVYKAEDDQGRKIALKIMSRDNPIDFEALVPLQGVVGETLQHPNLVSLYEAGQTPDAEYFALEYVRGYDLKNWLGQLGKLPIDWGCECIRQAALGLAHAHSKGLIHGDLRLRNLVMEERDVNSPPMLKILGLGLSHAIGREELPEDSFDYLAPEAADETAEIDERSDIYSLGCILYEMLTGRRAYEGETIEDRFAARLTTDPIPPAELRSEMPAELSDTILRMMARNPDERFDTAEEVAEALRPWAMEEAAQEDQAQAAAGGIRDEEGFFQALKESRLIAEEDLPRIRRQIPDHFNAKQASNLLVELGHITWWQSRQLLSGRTDFFVGKYKLLDRIGTGGGIGIVHKAEDPLGRVVTAKVLTMPEEMPANLITRFRREGRIAASLEHENIVRVYDAGEEQDRLYLIMEFVEGRSLKSWLEEVSMLPVGWSCECIRQAAQGLQYAFDHGIVHRDIQPKNLLVDEGELNEKPRVRILDMGLAKMVSGGSQTGSVTPGDVLAEVDYISPEQCDNPQLADIRSDIFSLGCTLYHMLTGRLPFVGLSDVERITARQTQDAPPLVQFNAEVSEELQAVILKMLARDPQERYQTPDEVAKALEPFSRMEQKSGVLKRPSLPFRTIPLDDLFATIERYQLLTPGQLTQVKSEVDPTTNTQKLIGSLVERGWLSSWQQMQLITGGHEFYLGDYKLLELKGQGATGDVYKALDPQGKTVALKVLSSTQEEEPHVLARFQREGRLAQLLNHDNVVGTLAAERLSNRLCLVMEYVEGRDLNYWIQYYKKRNEFVPMGWACEVIRQAALGLEHAHEHEVVHRDIKPGNLLVIGSVTDETPHVKILDMGVASALHDDLKGGTITKPGELLGTPDYMPPEQVHDPTHVDFRADVYSLGATLFHLLANRPPYVVESGGTIAKLTVRLKEDPPRLSQFRRDVPTEVDTLIAAMLDRDPSKRPQSAAEIAKRLAPFGTGMVPAAAPSRAQPPAPEPAAPESAAAAPAPQRDVSSATELQEPPVSGYEEEGSSSRAEGQFEGSAPSYSAFPQQPAIPGQSLAEQISTGSLADALSREGVPGDPFTGHTGAMEDAELPGADVQTPPQEYATEPPQAENAAGADDAPSSISSIPETAQSPAEEREDPVVSSMETRQPQQQPASPAPSKLPLPEPTPEDASLNSMTFVAPEVQKFMGVLRESQLLPPEEFEETVHGSVNMASAQDVARQLVRKQWVTRWQARQLLSGESNFFVGDYLCLECIGRGATGSVYMATKDNEDIVALKVLSPDLLENQDAVARFEREMRVAAALNHDNIVAYREAGQDGDYRYLAMEYVDGVNLKRWNQEYPQLPVEWACECVRQAARGLQHAHEQGIIHRDVKPSNLLVIAPDLHTPPLVKILDMGFANATSPALKKSDLTQENQLLGTPDYMSPEQARNPATVDIRSDVYSLGCTLFRLLTGEPPFPGSSPTEKLNARCFSDAPPIRQYRKDIPQELEVIIARMLERNPNARHQTPEEVAEDLEAFLAGEKPPHALGSAKKKPKSSSSSKPKESGDKKGWFGWFGGKK